MRLTHLLRPAKLLALPCTDLTDTLGPRELLFPGFQRIGLPSTVAGDNYDSDWTPRDAASLAALTGIPRCSGRKT